MAYERPRALGEPPEVRVIERRLCGLGMLLGQRPDPEAMIEPTLVHGVRLALDGWDMRALGVLVVWLEVHHARVHVPWLLRCVREQHPPASAPELALWSALGQWLERQDRRFVALARLYDGPRLDVLPGTSATLLARRGEDPRFEATLARIPEGTLRRRLDDVLSPEDLASLHPGYRNRVIMGASWRAVLWTLLERQPSLSAAALAREARCAFATAWQVRRDFLLIHASAEAQG
ncbi:MAG: hypothetical protein KC492_21295, partial [Myxococcales bacterium]|nr:hypothetical protein [Myxococcales bacterium]